MAGICSKGWKRSYYENGQKEREVTWVSGRRTGTETYWARQRH